MAGHHDDLVAVLAAGDPAEAARLFAAHARGEAPAPGHYRPAGRSGHTVDRRSPVLLIRRGEHRTFSGYGVDKPGQESTCLAGRWDVCYVPADRLEANRS